MLHPLSCVLLRTCISIFLLLVSVSLGWTDSPKAPAEQPQTVVAIGDVHGDFDDFVPFYSTPD